MTSSCCSFAAAAEEQFSAAKVSAEVRRYRAKGPGPTTRLLRDGAVALRLTLGRVIDVGGGFGPLTHELLDRGTADATIVETSSAFLAAAAEEAKRRGRTELVELVHGDFVAVAERLPAATLIALDRVVCCYPAYAPLLTCAGRLAERGLVLSYPRDRWLVRLALGLENAVRRWKGNPFRAFVHPPEAIARLLNDAGFVLAWRRSTFMWSADVFVRHG